VDGRSKASGKHITGGLLSAAMRLTPHHINELLEAGSCLAGAEAVALQQNGG